VNKCPVGFAHEQAFADLNAARAEIAAACAAIEVEPVFLLAQARDISLETAVATYLFNSQLVTRPDGGMSLILPGESEVEPGVRAFIERCVAGDGPIDDARFLDLRESMRNGGGPACLRLRVALSRDELARVHPGVMLDAPKIDRLEAWVKAHYRDRLDPEDLADPALIDEIRGALDELTMILNLGALYEFQQ
jgi:succinylarginine dihydrolase